MSLAEMRRLRYDSAGGLLGAADAPPVTRRAAVTRRATVTHEAEMSERVVYKLLTVVLIALLAFDFGWVIRTALSVR